MCGVVDLLVKNYVGVLKDGNLINGKLRNGNLINLNQYMRQEDYNTYVTKTRI